MRRNAVGIALATLVATNSMLAQRVRGTLTDSTTHEPILGAVISISDTTGRFLARGVAGPDGRFDVPRLAGSKRIHVVRIGYRPVDALVPSADAPLELHMLAIASQLAVVQSSVTRVCPGETGNSQALELWEQARTGFLASIVARDARPPSLKLRYVRVERDPVLRRVVDDSVWAKDLVGDQPFIAARSASAFESEGYMHEHADGERDYFAPDETVLLDQAFAGSHCFRVTAADPEHFGWVGIGFEPAEAERDTLVDVRGVLWMDAKTLELRTLDFSFTNLEKVRGGSGGTLTFQSTPSGVPMIVHWTIHSPIIATDEGASPPGIRRRLLPRPQRTNFRVLGYQTLAAEVRHVTWSDGTRWNPRVAAITGLVVDLRGRVVTGARVWMFGLADTAVTDSSGVFRLARPAGGGLFTLVAADSTLAAGGVNQTPPHLLTVSDDRSPSSDIDVDILKMYPRADALTAACPDNKYEPGKGVAIVRVIDTLGLSVSEAAVEMETQQTVVAGDTTARRIRRSGNTDSEGRFLVCGAALDQPMSFRASHREWRGEGRIARWSSDVMALTIVLRRGAS